MPERLDGGSGTEGRTKITAARLDDILRGLELVKDGTLSIYFIEGDNEAEGLLVNSDNVDEVQGEVVSHLGHESPELTSVFTEHGISITE